MSDQQQPPTPGDPTQPPPTTPAASITSPSSAYPAYPSGGGPSPLPPASTTKATWALILAIVPAVLTWIAAVVLSIQVLADSRDGRNHGKGRAIAALIICGLWVVVTILIVIGALAGRADRDETGKVTEAGKVDVTKVQVGDCVSDEDTIVGEESSSINVVPCSKPHAYEAYANFTLTGGDYPGDDEVASKAEDGCAKRFADFVGKSFDSSELDVTYLYPLGDSWELDKGVTCMITDGTTTGSLKNANR